MRDWEAFVRERLSLPKLQPEREQHIICELAAQLDDFYRDGLSRGLTETEADVFAREQIRDWDCLASDVQRADVIGKRPEIDNWLEQSADRAHRGGGLRSVVADLMLDVRYALRRLRKSPGFSLATVLTLALGIGANAAIFTLVYGIVINPLPYSEPDRIVNLWHAAPGLGADQFELSPGTFVHFQDGADSFVALALYDRNAANLTGGTEPERINIARVTSEIFPVLSVSPILGRALRSEDDEPGAMPVAVLSHELWRRGFGSDRAVLGRTIQLDGVSREIVGILPSGLSFPNREVRILDSLRAGLRPSNR